MLFGMAISQRPALKYREYCRLFLNFDQMANMGKNEKAFWINSQVFLNDFSIFQGASCRPIVFFEEI